MTEIKKCSFCEKETDTTQQFKEDGKIIMELCPDCCQAFLKGFDKGRELGRKETLQAIHQALGIKGGE